MEIEDEDEDEFIEDMEEDEDLEDAGDALMSTNKPKNGKT